MNSRTQVADILRLPAFRFLIVGGACTALYFLLASMLIVATTISAGVASLAAYVCAAIVSYFSHRVFTFKVSIKHNELALRFIVVAASGYVLSFLLPYVLTDRFDLPPLLSLVLVSVCVPIINSLAISRYVFARSLFVAFAKVDAAGKGPSDG